jgi:hypothetical protein
MLTILANLTMFLDQLSPVVVGDSAQLMNALSKAGPGSVIKIAPGTYRGGVCFESAWGTEPPHPGYGARPDEATHVHERVAILKG